MDYFLLWFILANGAGGYRAPLEVRMPSCGKPGAIVGLVIEPQVNPTTALWPDPSVAGEHCELDISAHVFGLPFGEYQSCTTEIGKARAFGELVEPYIGIDPHCSTLWRRIDGTVTPPTVLPSNLRMRGQQ